MHRKYIFNKEFENGFIYKTGIYVGDVHPSYKKFLKRKHRLENKAAKLQNKLNIIYADLLKDSGI